MPRPVILEGDSGYGGLLDQSVSLLTLSNSTAAVFTRLNRSIRRGFVDLKDSNMSSSISIIRRFMSMKASATRCLVGGKLPASAIAIRVSFKVRRVAFAWQKVGIG